MPGKAEATSGLGISEARICLDFVNTEGEVRNDPPDRLADLGVFLSWAVDRGLCSAEEAADLRPLEGREPAAVARFLDRARELREALYRIFAATLGDRRPAEADLAVLNRELAAAFEGLRLAWAGDRARWALPDLRRPDQLLGPVASSAADLLRSPRLERVKECRSETCASLFIDESKNRSRRWCDMADCGNRAKARRYYERHRRP